ncbi:MAG: CPBP family intramembrane glutamic endopeptidase [Micrococcales bacterium]
MTPSKKQYYVEVLLVLLASLGASAVYSLISLVQTLLSPKGLGGSTQTISQQTTQDLVFETLYKVVGTAFNLAPAAIALYLLWAVSQRSLKSIGFDLTQIRKDAPRALLLAASIGIPGIGLYFAARAFGLAAQIQPSNYSPNAVTVSLMVLAAIKAGILEEVIVVAYLQDRLERIGFKPRNQLLISAGLRGSYHLYQGFAGFIGNFVMGLAFGWAYKKWGRVAPLVIAHSIMDTVVFVAYFWLPFAI